MFLGKLIFWISFQIIKVLSMFLDSKYNLYIYNNIQNFTIISYLGCKKFFVFQGDVFWKKILFWGFRVKMT